MKKHIRIFLAGMMIVAPIAVTAYAVVWAGAGLDNLARSGIQAVAPAAKAWLFPGVGAILLIVAVYLVGLLTRVWGFRWIMRLVEGVFARLPGIKALYESVRDILKLFGGDSKHMGQVVRYRLPGTDAKVLGIRTSTAPRGAADPGRVAVYLPMSYMVGGMTVYVPADAVEPVEMSVEEALKIAATAEVGQHRDDPPGAKAP